MSKIENTIDSKQMVTPLQNVNEIPKDSQITTKPLLDGDKPLVSGVIRDAMGRFTPGGALANPNGRPKGSLSLTGTLRKRLEEHPNEVDSIIEALIKLGKSCNMPAIEHMFDRIDGKVAETHRIEGDIPINIIFSAFPLDASETSPNQNLTEMSPVKERNTTPLLANGSEKG